MAEANSTAPPFNLFRNFRRVWHLMLPKERRRVGLLFVGTIINSFVEILGLAAIIPIIGLVIQPELIHSNSYLHQAFTFTQAIGIETEGEFLILAAIGLIFAFLFKAILNLGLNLIQTRFSLRIGHRISGMMWSYHFSQSLERMRSSESGKVLEEINRWPLVLASAYFVGSMRLLNEVTVILMIGIGLLTYSPVVLISVGILIGIGALIIRNTTRAKLQSISELRRQLMPKVSTAINNAIRGFLEVISFRASDPIRDEYLKDTALLYRIDSNLQVLNLAPSKLYEVLAVMGISLSIIVGILIGDTNEEFLNLLIIMAIAAYRVMPSMNRLNGQVFLMRSNYFMLNRIESALQEFKRTGPQKSEAVEDIWSNPRIEIENLTVGYKALEEPVFQNLKWIFEPSKINAIVGPSGSGKSTLVNSILGLQPSISGKIRIGENSTELFELGATISKQEWLAQVGYLSQSPFLFNGTVEDNLTMRIPEANINPGVVHELVKRLDLGDCLGDEPLQFELLEGGNNLSGGQQQRLAILRALIYDRSVLILDEATSALDRENRDKVIALLRERAEMGVTVLLITHDTEVAEQCDTCLNLMELNRETT